MTFAFALASVTVVGVTGVVVVRITPAFTFGLLSSFSPPFANNGRVVGERGLFVFNYEFRDLKLWVAGKAFVGVEFNEFVEGEGACYVSVRTRSIDRIVGFVCDCV